MVFNPPTSATFWAKAAGENVAANGAASGATPCPTAGGPTGATTTVGVATVVISAGLSFS